MVRIGVDERRARLVRRHRLAVESRGGSPLEVAESLVRALIDGDLSGSVNGL